MRLTYVTRSFLDYRVPVFMSIANECRQELTVIYSADYVPPRTAQFLQAELGAHAIGMTGEKRIGPNPRDLPAGANSAIRVVYQPGLMRAISRSEPDVVIGDGFFQWSLFAFLYRLSTSTPLVVCYERTFHTERNAQWYRRIYRRLAARFIDGLACNGSLSKAYAISLGVPAERITTGQMVADTHRLAKKASAVSNRECSAIRCEWGDIDLAILIVGRLVKTKGIAEALEAWANMKMPNPLRLALVMVGDGPDAQMFQGLSDKLQLRNVFFCGWQDYDKLPAIYAASDALLMPTLEDNWSLVVPEAMACGLPVLCSIYNGCHPELINEGENGWTFDPLDRGDFERVLRLCIENHQRLPKMGEESRRIVSKYTPESAAKAIIDACRIGMAARRN